MNLNVLEIMGRVNGEGIDFHRILLVNIMGTIDIDRGANMICFWLHGGLAILPTSHHVVHYL